MKWPWMTRKRHEAETKDLANKLAWSQLGEATLRGEVSRNERDLGMAQSHEKSLRAELAAAKEQIDLVRASSYVHPYGIVTTERPEYIVQILTDPPHFLGPDRRADFRPPQYETCRIKLAQLKWSEYIAGYNLLQTDIVDVLTERFQRAVKIALQKVFITEATVKGKDYR